ncbi:dicarboxylate/amino acid:cation symporter [Geobacter sp. DSM 9736]|uniref:dicarboxylate/amino acid:cation symporter n=1 Tax=Geobacter sp. DSM 9736 TaxID=1277350 RepID=UPI000B5044DA|nr:dicarboxylate/amino acid:cation symporter [Geobacter sp. DSM 9736]SNB47122.1 Na+/H+-dicarboxylate symporter [Geobacter sp. DSM 9736]
MKLLKTYGFSLLLILSIVTGLLLGSYFPETARAIRPLGDLFLNLLFMIIVPLVFFTVSSSIASSASTHRLSRVSWNMLLVFLSTSVVAAVTSLGFMLLVHPTPGAGIHLEHPPAQEIPSFLAQVVKAFTASDFPELISRKSMLPLIVFSVGVGLATLSRKEAGVPFAGFLASGAQVFTRLIDYVMYVAPVGLLAWFAATVVDTGDALASAYFKVFVVYYTFSALYFIGGFSLYAFAAGRFAAVRRFWAHMLNPSLTSLGTCSSMATMPVNLEAAPKMGVPQDVSNVVVPVGAALHKDGSVIGGVLKVLFAMSLFGQALTFERMIVVIGVSILVGVVVGAIPSGGMMGEMLILSVFGFPPETLPLLAAISVIIDPVATLLNATGDNVAAMLVTRLTTGNVWRLGSKGEES